MEEIVSETEMVVQAEMVARGLLIRVVAAQEEKEEKVALIQGKRLEPEGSVEMEVQAAMGAAATTFLVVPEVPAVRAAIVAVVGAATAGTVEPAAAVPQPDQVARPVLVVMGHPTEMQAQAEIRAVQLRNVLVGKWLVK